MLLRERKVEEVVAFRPNPTLLFVVSPACLYEAGTARDIIALTVDISSMNSWSDQPRTGPWIDWNIRPPDCRQYATSIGCRVFEG